MASVGDLEITVGELPRGGTLLRVAGELDLATVAQLEEALGGAHLGAQLVIDLTDCSFLDSSAVRVLLATVTERQQAESAVALVAPDLGIRRLLEIAGLDSLLPIHSALAEAI